MTQVPKEYLHSAELRDIMQFGSSATAVFFKMRVAGVLHIFQFDTRQGEDICMALQTHINDIMIKRYSKVCCFICILTTECCWSHWLNCRNAPCNSIMKVTCHLRVNLDRSMSQAGIDPSLVSIEHGPN